MGYQQESPNILQQVKKAVKTLTRANIISDMNKRRDMALYYFKELGEFNTAVREWENKSAADKTWTHIKMFVSAEYARKNKQNKLFPKQFKANPMEEQAEAMEESIATLIENHTPQMEALINSTMYAMKEMMQLIKNEAKTSSNPTKLLDKDKKKKRDEQCKWYNEAPICTHCEKKAPIEEGG
jgi:hypothetical protein